MCEHRIGFFISIANANKMTMAVKTYLFAEFVELIESLSTGRILKSVRLRWGC
jgi:hypothetical protein